MLKAPNEEPRSKLLGIEDFTLKSLSLRGNISPAPPVTAASCGVLNQMLRNKLIFFTVFWFFPFVFLFAEEVSVFPQLGHSEGISAIAFSPDGKSIATSSWDQTIKIWDIASGREISTYFGSSHNIVSMDWSSNGIIVSGAWDGTITIWNTIQGKPLETFQGHNGAVHSVTYSNDGKRIISGGLDKAIKIWDENGGLIRILDGHDGAVNSLTFGNGNRIISGSRDGSIKIWDGESGRLITSLYGNKGSVQSVVSDSEERLAAAYSNGLIGIWDTVNKKEYKVLQGHKGPVYSLALSPDGKKILSCSFDKTVKLWDIETGSLLRNFSGHYNTVVAVAFSPDGENVVSGSWDGTVRRWDTEGDRENKIFAGNVYYLNYASYHPKRQWIVTASTNFNNSIGIITIWDIGNGTVVKNFIAHSLPINQIFFSRDGKYIISNSTDGMIKLWDAETGRLIKEFFGRNGQVSSAALSDDGTKIAAGLFDGTILQWDVATGKELLSIGEKNSSITSLIFSRDGNILFSGLSDGTTISWDATTSVRINIYEGHMGTINSVALSPDEKLLASCSWDARVIIREMDTGRILHTFTGHGDPVRSIAFSPDGKEVVSSSGSIFASTGDRTIRIWDMETGKNTQTISDHRGNVNSVSYDKDGRSILSCSYDGTTRLWDAATGKEIASFIAFTDGEWIVITPDGYYNASPKGDEHLNIRIGNEVFSIDQFSRAFYHPEVVAARLQGLQDPDVVRQFGDIRLSNAPPAVKVEVLNKETAGVSGIAELNVTAFDQFKQYPIDHIEIIVNGRLVGGDELKAADGEKLTAGIARLTTVTGAEAQVEFSLPVRLDEGLNRIEVVAANEVNYGIRTVLLNSGVLRQKPNLWMLAIGINDYEIFPGEVLEDDRMTTYLDLRSAAGDAEKITAVFEMQERKRFEKIYKLIIADNHEISPTKENIISGMSFLKQAKEDDVVLLFIAAHGKTDQGRYYFMPRNIRIKANREIDFSGAVNIDEIISLLEIPCRKLIFIDTCQSGGVDNNKLVRTLKNRSTVIFSASRQEESSMENLLYGGLFTYSLVEGVSGKAAKSGIDRIEIEALGDYVSGRVELLSRDRRTGVAQQHPTKVVPDGFKGFVIAE